MSATKDSQSEMTFEFFSLVDMGRVRTNNEDSVSVHAERQIVVLADGMGGYNAGEVASSMATELIQGALVHWSSQRAVQASPREWRRAIELSVDEANESIFHAAMTIPHYSGMGTTVVVGVFQHDRVMIAHVGDSRAYRLRAGELTRLTRDHSLLQEQIDADLISPEQARFASHRNLITRALGVDEVTETEVKEHRAEPGDLYLFCSDGLTDMLDDETIADLLTDQGSLENKGRVLVQAANQAGGRDNISVVLAYAANENRRKGLLLRMLGQ